MPGPEPTLPGAAGRLSPRQRVGVLVVLLLGVPGGVPGGPLGRQADPVVLTGGEVAALTGMAPGELVAFRHDSGWQQIPIQVDERDRVDWAVIYNDPPIGFTGLVYADPGTFTGPDSNAALDVDDEIVVMAENAGFAAPLFDEPVGVIPGTGVELRLDDPLDGATGYVYLFRQDGTLDPGLGQSPVDYDFGLLSGDYRTTYNVDSGPNPEDTRIVSPFYEHHFSDRWIHDGLKIFAGGATGVDLLDRHKSQFAPGNCARTEDTFSNGEGAFVVNKAGPVRAIRSYLGANSGPLTQREHVFYPRRQDIRTFLRVHAISGVVDYFDYEPPAAGMVYRSNLDPTGVTIDGNPETSPAGALTWEMVDGQQGALVIVHTRITDAADLTETSYYLDDATPAVTQCTGDAFAYGSSGPWIDSAIPCTDPVLCAGTANTLIAVRTLYYGAPGTSVEQALRFEARVRSPLTFGVAPWIGSPGEVPGATLRLAKSPVEPGSIELNWSPGCSTTADGHAVYEGLLGDFDSHVPVDCAVAGTSSTLQPLSGDRYYLIVPVSSTVGVEGSYGRDATGAERPASTTPCLPHAPRACS